LLSIESGETVRTLTIPPDAQSRPIASLAPDGHALVFPVTSGGLVIQPLSNSFEPNGPARRIPFRPGTISGLAWSADSRDIIFAYGNVGVTSGRPTDGSLWRVPASGAAAPHRLPFALNGGTPAIARRGDRLAFTGSVGEVDIWSLRLDEGGRADGPAVKAFDSSKSEFSPAFSPDGARVAFESDRSGASAIYVCLSDGSNCAAVTSSDGVQVGSPTWSPDGNWLAYDAATAGTHSEIDVISSSGGKPRVLVQGFGPVVLPCWSAGEWIYFNHSYGPESNIYRVSVSGGKPEQVTRFGANTAKPSADGKWIYTSVETWGRDVYAPLWRFRVSGGEPAEMIHEVLGRNYVPVEKGIWYLTPFSQQGSLLRFYDFATGASRTVYRLPRRPFGGLTVSPDGRRILFTQIDQDLSSDLMLVENFR
jgi:Tol biopolymer transport system component